MRAISFSLYSFASYLAVVSLCLVCRIYAGPIMYSFPSSAVNASCILSDENKFPFQK